MMGSGELHVERAITVNQLINVQSTLILLSSGCKEVNSHSITCLEGLYIYYSTSMEMCNSVELVVLKHLVVGVHSDSSELQ